ncbi:MAG: sugar ABC transporter ATP-binding protein [Saccharofermentanales bacterium]
MNQDIILSMKNITKTYPGVVAIDNISLDFRRGEIHALIGENGAGKSTLIKCLCGAETPDSGVMELNGVPYTRISPRDSRQHGVEVIYQEINLIDDLSVAENVCLGDEIGKWVSFRKLNAKASRIFERMNVAMDVKKMVRDLSTAQQQLVEIAKALSKDAQLLVLDEPTAPLTTNEVENLFSIVGTLKSHGVTMIYISHRLDEIFRISDRVTVLRDGKFVETLNTAETDRKTLIKLMVGRELSETYPRRSNITDIPVIETRNLCGSVPRNINIHVNKGEIVGLAGLVGAGRTELARAIFGADKITAGELFLDGQPIKIRSPKHAIQKGIGLIPEDRKQQGCFLYFGIDWNISIANMPSISRFGFIKHKRVKQDAIKYRDLLDIRTPSLDQLVVNLSGGNQQKVVLAKTLATNSNVIIFDEPTRGIDVGAKQEIYQLMTRLADEGNAILMISSDMEELLGMSDRLYVLCEGRLAGQLKREEFDQVRVLELASGEE